MKIIFSVLLLGLLVTGAFAQRPLDPDPAAKAQKPAPAPAPAPKTVKAKYEGGVFGYTKTMEGTLTFDDDNKRLLFKDKKPPKEIHIPYEAITSAFADTQRRRPAAATVASHIPTIWVPNPASFIRTKVRYLTLQYLDPDSGVNGITSFRLDNKEILASVLKALADKTGMTQRGDIYVKKRPEDSSKAAPPK
ncbi:MAG TPA: hypothetical protein VJM50_07000 [Pyrinomonadaceae bacterium]|nr:hypothetical protein [Pyrinomonadaceae bacterium]